MVFAIFELLIGNSFGLLQSVGMPEKTGEIGVEHSSSYLLLELK